MSDPRDITIRQMVREDVGVVADLTSQLGYPATASDIQRRYDLIRDRSDARLLVAMRAEGGIVGWIHVQVMCSLESDRRAEIWGLVVAESARGTGVGRRLVEAAEEWARTLGITAIALRSNQLRVGAKAFYEHLGYEIVKTQNAFRKTLRGD
jgi:GNAT superfamily N-acetyltransferase